MNNWSMCHIDIPGRVAMLVPQSVDDIVVPAPTTLLAVSRLGNPGDAGMSIADAEIGFQRGGVSKPSNAAKSWWMLLTSGDGRGAEDGGRGGKDCHRFARRSIAPLSTGWIP